MVSVYRSIMIGGLWSASVYGAVAAPPCPRLGPVVDIAAATEGLPPASRLADRAAWVRRRAAQVLAEELRRLPAGLRLRHPRPRQSEGPRRGTVHLIDGEGEVVAYLSYAIETDVSTRGRARSYLEVSRVERIQANYPYARLSDVLLAQAVLDWPRIDSIHGSLAESNARQIDEALLRGESRLDALRGTSAYRARARLGFAYVPQEDGSPTAEWVAGRSSPFLIPMVTRLPP